MNLNTHAAAAVAVMTGVTLLLRVLPFLLFREGRVPACIGFLGKYLPYSIMAMLVVYCLRNVSFIQAPFGLPEIGGVVLVAVLHLRKRNTLLSIAAGTVFYMVLIRVI